MQVEIKVPSPTAIANCNPSLCLRLYFLNSLGVGHISSRQLVIAEENYIFPNIFLSVIEHATVLVNMPSSLVH